MAQASVCQRLPLRTEIAWAASRQHVGASKHAQNRMLLRMRPSLRPTQRLVGSSFEDLRGLSLNVPNRRSVERRIATRAAVSTGSKGSTAEAGVSEAVALLKEAAKTRKVEAGKITRAIIDMEKAKLDPSKFLEHIGGTDSPGHYWMLVFTSSKKDVTAVRTGGKVGGTYVPITAVQHFDAQTNLIENGVYLRSLGSLVFAGLLGWKNRQLSFTFDRVSVRLGPWKPFTFKFGSGDTRTPGVGKEGAKDPFFLFAYADDEIVAARGRGGGVAFWVRCKHVKRYQM